MATTVPDDGGGLPSLDAGDEMDRLVYERVRLHPAVPGAFVPRYSRRMRDALVAWNSHFERTGGTENEAIWKWDGKLHLYRASMSGIVPFGRFEGQEWEAWGWGQTLPLAICRCILHEAEDWECVADEINPS